MGSDQQPLQGEVRVPPKTTHKRKKCSGFCAYKTLSVIYGFVYFIIGLLLLGLGLWLEMIRKDHTSIINILTSLSVFCIIIGAIMLLTAFLIIVGALKESILLVKIFLAAAILVFVLQLIIGIMAFVYRKQVETSVETNLRDAMGFYNQNEGVTKAIDFIQEKLKCCGLSGPYDWDSNEQFSCRSRGVFACGVPDSCCRGGKENTGCGQRIRDGIRGRTLEDRLARLRQLGIWTNGCSWSFIIWLQTSLDIVGGTALAYAIIHILGMVFVYLLYTRLEDRRKLYSCRKHPNM